MSFQMRKLSVGSMAVLFVSLLAMIITSICITITSFLFWAFFTINCICLVADGIVLIWDIIQERNMNKLSNKLLQEQKDADLIILGAYGALGIPPQYDKNGRLIDIYELLGFLPEFDEDGNRISTIYELLGFNPKFNKNIKEIPNVFAIKHYASKIAKLKNPEIVKLLTRKMTPQEKEYYENERLLKQAYKEKGIMPPVSAAKAKKKENPVFKTSKIKQLKRVKPIEAVNTHSGDSPLNSFGKTEKQKSETKTEGQNLEKANEPEGESLQDDNQDDIDKNRVNIVLWHDKVLDNERENQ
ncbi:MAG: hypothetical protein RR334_03135 [Clostridia bacterium]